MTVQKIKPRLMRWKPEIEAKIEAFRKADGRPSFQNAADRMIEIAWGVISRRKKQGQ